MIWTQGDRQGGVVHVYAADGLCMPTSETPVASLFGCAGQIPWKSPVSGLECKNLRDTLVG